MKQTYLVKWRERCVADEKQSMLKELVWEGRTEKCKDNQLRNCRSFLSYTVKPRNNALQRTSQIYTLDQGTHHCQHINTYCIAS